jgi:hypothetical protein
VSASSAPDSLKSARVGRLSARSSTFPEIWKKGDDVHVEFAGDDLEPSADLGDLEPAVQAAALSLHQLQVVDDDDAEIAEAAAQRRPLARSSVMVTSRLSSTKSGPSLMGDGTGQVGPIRLGEPAVADPAPSGTATS